MYRLCLYVFFSKLPTNQKQIKKIYRTDFELLLIKVCLLIEEKTKYFIYSPTYSQLK